MKTEKRITVDNLSSVAFQKRMKWVKNNGVENAKTVMDIIKEYNEKYFQLDMFTNYYQTEPMHFLDRYCGEDDVTIESKHNFAYLSNEGNTKYVDKVSFANTEKKLLFNLNKMDDIEKLRAKILGGMLHIAKDIVGDDMIKQIKGDKERYCTPNKYKEVFILSHYDVLGLAIENRKLIVQPLFDEEDIDTFKASHKKGDIINLEYNRSNMCIAAKGGGINVEIITH